MLKNFNGDIILSFGNYDESNSKNYLDELNKNYNLIQHYLLNMPWGSKEHIKIFKRK